MVRIWLLILFLDLVSSRLFQIKDLEDPPPKDPNSIRISIIGDSITEWNVWPRELDRLIGSNNVEIGNFAVSGATISLNRTPSPRLRPYRFTDKWEIFKKSQPDIIIFMLGSCDAKWDNWQANSVDNFESEYGGWLKYLKGFNRT